MAHVSTNVDHALDDRPLNGRTRGAKASAAHT
jgi:hypothetical protein